MKTSDQLDKLIEALAKAQGQMKNPEKNRTAKIPTKDGGYEYNYADLPITYDAARKCLSENGLAHTTLLETREHTVVAIGILMHSSGQMLVSEWELGPREMNSRIKAAEYTFARRYLFTAMTGMAADEDMDSAPEQKDDQYVAREKPKATAAPAPKALVVQPRAISPQNAPQGTQLGAIGCTCGASFVPLKPNYKLCPKCSSQKFSSQQTKSIPKPHSRPNINQAAEIVSNTMNTFRARATTAEVPPWEMDLEALDNWRN